MSQRIFYRRIMEIKPLGSDIWTKVEGEEHKEILTNKNPKDTPAMKEG